jgi:mono/diheme cytochrome c family protein
MHLTCGRKHRYHGLMRLPFLKLFSGITLTCLGLIGCQHSADPSHRSSREDSFAAAQVVLERNCVHCHGEIRLPQMPSIATSQSLGDLIGPGKWVVPGKPEESRLFQVVTLNDDQAGAMPPTGHKVTEPEIAKLRAWILDGAKIPADAPVTFKPRGVAPRSR